MDNDEIQIVALIPARGGSKRLPDKNLLKLGGHPLVAWTVSQAMKNKWVSQTVISSDSEQIIFSAQEYGASAPFKRPDSLASDTASTNDVILHAIDQLHLANPDIIVLLQPTSPLRADEDINGALELFLKNDADGVVSVCECEHSPLWSGKLSTNYSFSDFFESAAQTERSQSLPIFHRLNGSIFIFRVGALKKNGGIHYSDNVYGYVMPIERSGDIDTEYDFFISEALLNARRVRIPLPSKPVRD